jgi:hypothetical protein
MAVGPAWRAGDPGGGGTGETTFTRASPGKQAFSMGYPSWGRGELIEVGLG